MIRCKLYVVLCKLFDLLGQIRGMAYFQTSGSTKMAAAFPLWTTGKDSGVWVKVTYSFNEAEADVIPSTWQRTIAPKQGNCNGFSLYRRLVFRSYNERVTASPVYRCGLCRVKTSLSRPFVLQRCNTMVRFLSTGMPG